MVSHSTRGTKTNKCFYYRVQSFIQCGLSLSAVFFVGSSIGRWIVWHCRNPIGSHTAAHICVHPPESSRRLKRTARDRYSDFAWAIHSTYVPIFIHTNSSDLLASGTADKWKECHDKCIQLVSFPTNWAVSFSGLLFRWPLMLPFCYGTWSYHFSLSLSLFHSC